MIAATLGKQLKSIPELRGLFKIYGRKKQNGIDDHTKSNGTHNNQSPRWIAKVTYVREHRIII